MTLHQNDFIKVRNAEIRAELSKAIEQHSWKFLDSFRKIFPCKELYLLEITYECNWKGYKTDVYYMPIENHNKFWTDWHKFTKLKAFL